MASERRSSSPIELPADTLAVLQQFLDEKKAAEEDFNARYNSSSAGKVKRISIKEFREQFGEDWQLSQFWCPSLSELFVPWVQALHKLCTASTKIIFISCPTSYVGFNHDDSAPQSSSAPQAFLFEYDTRFRLFAGDQFVHYDLNKPEEGLPDVLVGKVDIAVIDPPFLNQTTNDQVAKTLRKLLHSKSKVVLLTSTSVREQVMQSYKEEPMGPLLETEIQVEHDAGRLSNQFAVWNNWDSSWNI